jgi:hypothetical protein
MHIRTRNIYRYGTDNGGDFRGWETYFKTQMNDYLDDMVDEVEEEDEDITELDILYL